MRILGKVGKFYRVLLAVVAIVALGAGFFAGCGSEDKAEEKSGKLIVVGIDKFEPYSYQNVNGEFAGIDVELAREAFGRMGYEPEFQFIPWEEKNNLLADGSIDCIWSCYSYTDREDKYQWSGPYMYSRQVVAVRADSNIKTLADLANKRIGVQATTKGENLFLHVVKTALPQAKQVNSFATTEELFAVLRKGYVDAIAGHEALISKLVHNGSNQYRMLEESPYTSQIGVAFAKGTHKDLSDRLTATLEEMKQDGTISRIAHKYGLDGDKAVGGEANEK